ncbi:hypothetical protein PG994_002310 [Apiospora phragmitis]|uniref:Uncharacterized protein n=1 Tax=Apiospora phragmitis TaxID=2905665 RepID=A0ABR1WW03_9PEZI
MRHFTLATLLVYAGLIACQDVTWCRDKKCEDCPSGLASSGPGYPECVVYDSKTVFGGQGFDDDTEGKIEFKVFGNFKDPCDGKPGNYMVRSPASLEAEGCGNLIYSTQKPQCSGEIDLESTFKCDKAQVPAGRLDIDVLQGSSGGPRGAYLQFENGTVIEPLVVGAPRASLAASSGLRRKTRRCTGYKDDSYVADGEIYYKTFETQVASANVPAQSQDRSFQFDHTQSVSRSTTFDTTIGDPWGVISISTGESWEDTTTDTRSVTVAVPAGQSGYVSWTPIYRCTRGTLENCDGERTEVMESCAAYVTSNVVRGDYAFVQT